MNMQKFEEDLINNAPVATDYAPPAKRVEVVLQEGGKKLKDQIDKVIDEVAQSVINEIISMRKELDELEAVTIKSCSAAKVALGNHLTIAAQSMTSCNRIREQIAEFREQIEDSMPKNGST